MPAPFVRLTAVAAPLLRDNIDTDAIIPSREMTSVGKTGLADGLFAGWRYAAIGGRRPSAGFVLNDPTYRCRANPAGGRKLWLRLERANTLPGRSPNMVFARLWRPSFNPIFRGNCVRNGIVPVEQPAVAIAAIAAWVKQDAAGYRVTVDLKALTLLADAPRRFAIDEEAREMLLHGLDPIGLTLRQTDKIAAFRAADARIRPWAYL